MKFIITILLLTIGAFAQNTTYKDGINCNCDSNPSEYNESDELSSEIPYVNEKIHGVFSGYYVDGILFCEIPYVNGILNGIEKWYHRSGQLWEEIPYVNGKIHGIKKEYFKNGKLAGTATYKNGKLVGYKKCTDGRVGNRYLDCLH